MSQRGQSLMEYLLTLTLVGVVSIAAVSMLSETIGDTIRTINRQFTANVSPRALSPTASTPSPSASQSLIARGGIGGVVPTPDASQEQVCFESGLCANITLIPEGEKN